MSANPRLLLKHSTGWFAAGCEVAEALALLPDAAFRLYLYICLNADRHTGRLGVDTVNWAQALRKDPASIEQHLHELRSQGVCRWQEDMVEICDRYWPYEKRLAALLDDHQAEYVRTVREAFLAPACVSSSFTPADEKLAAHLFRRGVPPQHLRRAIWLGCARKYMAMLNGGRRAPISSLAYFVSLLEEITEATASDTYWEHLQQKVEALETRWQRRSSPPTDESQHAQLT
jgi:hypothetical protein